MRMGLASLFSPVYKPEKMDKKSKKRSKKSHSHRSHSERKSIKSSRSSKSKRVKVSKFGVKIPKSTKNGPILIEIMCKLNRPILV